jgi:hypothetical protein
MCNFASQNRLRARSLFTACVLSATTTILGCATHSSNTSVVAPVTLKDADPGTAVIYFFRPKSDVVNFMDKPTLTIEEQPVASLPSSSYTVLTLPPGKHKISLVAGRTDSREWNRTAEFFVQDGKSYYIALWNRNQPNSTPGYMSMYGAMGVLIANILNPMSGGRGVTFETVDRDIAEFELKGLKLIKSTGANPE